MLGRTLKTFHTLTKNPERYLDSRSDTAEEIRISLKEIYDFTRENEVTEKKILPHLIIEDLDDEQIWQELELCNTVKYNKCFKNVTSLLAKKEKLTFPFTQLGDCKDSDDNDEPADSFMNDTESDRSFELQNKPKQDLRPILKASVVDDKFFKLSELEYFLNKEDKRQQSKNDSDTESDTDYFEKTASDEEVEEVFYNKFFDPPHPDEAFTSKGDYGVSTKDKTGIDSDTRKKNLRFDLPQSEDGGIHCSDELIDSPNRPKSQFEMRQERLKSRIETLEGIALSEKPWQMRGEVSATNRPQNSLLEEVLEFDMMARPPPVVTERTTMKLEDIILQRIKDKVWDDVEKKVKPVLAPDEYKKRIVLDQEKSKLSLAEVYEQEYLKKKESLGAGADADADPEEKEEEPPEHRTIRSMMSSLFAKLDALTNYHFTPKMVLPEIKIVSHVPAIMMEEVTPVAASDGTLLAPQEIKAKPKSNLIGSSERTKTDKNRALRVKKKKQRIKQREKEKVAKIVEKLKPGLGNKYSKEKAVNALKKLGKAQNIEVDQSTGKSEVRSSATFFKQLEEGKSVGLRPKSKHAAKRK